MNAYWLLALCLFACTKPVKGVCCLDAADCKAAGIPEVRECEPGQACVENQCVVPSCSMTGCMAAMPVCDITTDVCIGCTDASQCSRFFGTNVCDTASGACVECVVAGDCPADRPICDTRSCRTCKLDSECASGACGDDGACVAEGAVVYMAPDGTDAGTCARTGPCRSFGYAVKQTSATRPHIVLNPGGYVGAQVRLHPEDTTAARLFIHGGGAHYSQAIGFDGYLINFEIATTVRDMQFFADGGGGLEMGGADTVIAERIRVSGGLYGIETKGTVVLRDVTIEGSATGIYIQSGKLTADGLVVHALTKGILGTQVNSVVTISNALVYGSSDLAIDLQWSSGTIAFSTIADSGSDGGSGPRAMLCATQVTLRSSIVWAPGLTPRMPLLGCNVVSTIAGPTAAAGAMNLNPQFVNAAARDYHLSPNSPARDAVDTGPSTDFEGDARPLGTRFDIGADEAQP
jgi:hypothetical protein